MRSFTKLLMLAIACLAAAGVAWSQTNCLCNGYSNTRTVNGWGFPDGTHFSRARANLDDPAYFPGVVNRNIVIPQSGVQTASSGLISSTDVFFTGLISGVTTSERNALLGYVQAGKNLVISADYADHSIADTFGVTLVEPPATLSEMNRAVQPEHPIFAGPFGRITQFRGAEDAAYFSAWPAGSLVLAVNASGPTMLLIPRGVLASGAGAVVLSSDVDHLTTFGRTTGNSSEPSIPVTDALVLNLVAFLCNPTAPASAPHLVFAQFANGQNNVSSLNMTNSATVANSATITFRDDSGQPFAPNIVGHGSASTFQTGNMPTNQTQTYTTDGRGTLRTGWAAVRASLPEITGNVMFFAPGLGATGVASSEIAGGFVLPVVRQPTGTTPIEVSTGLAVANLSGKAGNLRLELWDTVTGRRSDGIRFVPIPRYGHFAAFLFEIYGPTFDFRGFNGTLRIVSSDVLIAATGLQLGSAAGQFTALPIQAIYR
jgi:hypothetical protein